MPTKISHDLTLKDSFYKGILQRNILKFHFVLNFPSINWDDLCIHQLWWIGIYTPKTLQKQSSVVVLGEDEAILFLWGSKQRPSLPNLVSKTGPTWLGGFYFCSPCFWEGFLHFDHFLCLGGLKPPSCTTIVDASQKCWDPQLKGEFL